MHPGKHLSKVFLALLVLSLMSCTYGRLCNVERTMESDVQSADSMLSAIGMPSHGRNRALYAILKTQIDYKLYRDIPNDSLIRIATDYYGTRHRNFHAAMAWYSLGCISGELGDEINAADSYHIAMHLFPDTLVRYYALTEQNLGEIYLRNNLDAEAMSLLGSCRINSERSADSVTLAFCDYNIALNMLYQKQYKEAKEVFSDLMESRWLSSYSRDGVFLQLAKIKLFGEEDYLGSISFIDSVLVTGSSQSRLGQLFSIRADALYDIGYVDSAKQYYLRTINHTKDPYTLFDCYRRLAEISSKSGEVESRTLYESKADSCLESITDISKSNIIFNSQLNHSVPEKNNSIAHCLIVLTFLVPLALVIIKRKPKNQPVEKADVLDTAKSIVDFKDEIESVKRSEIYNEILAAIVNRETFFQHSKLELIEKSHGYLVDARSFLMSKYSLNSNEVDFCFFILLGVSQRNCQLFFNYSDSGVRTLKYRIKRKMPKSEFDFLFPEK